MIIESSLTAQIMRALMDTVHAQLENSTSLERKGKIAPEMEERLPGHIKLQGCESHKRIKAPSSELSALQPS